MINDDLKYSKIDIVKYDIVKPFRTILNSSIKYGPFHLISFCSIYLACSLDKYVLFNPNKINILIIDILI